MTVHTKHILTNVLQIGVEQSWAASVAGGVVFVLQPSQRQAVGQVCDTLGGDRADCGHFCDGRVRQVVYIWKEKLT